ncbi:MAG: ribonuclease J, partial [Polyangiaceae bacterium]
MRIFALGGLGEVGMNCLAIEDGGRVMLVDCGVTFDSRRLGVDVIHPEFAALDAYRDRIAGIFVTHGHEDHIGALPYFLRRFDVPIWGPKYALELVREKLGQFEVLEHATLIETEVRETYEVGPFLVEPIRVTHSIADATALAIETSIGTVIHTGDFKIDTQPTDGEHFDESRFAELGDKGVVLLMSDSTNVDSEGNAGNERSVSPKLETIVREAKGAVVVGLFASNVHRLRLLGEIALATGRKLVPLGRSVTLHREVATHTGYLSWPSDLVWSAENAKSLPRSKILAIATGTQAETRAALARLSRGDHPHFTVGRGDVVAFSSRIIPGNEPEVYRMMGDLLRRGVEVRSRATDKDIHVSGHAHRGEQRRMIELTRPKAFLPLHGTMHHLSRHAELAREAGVANVLVIENGAVAEVDANGTLEAVGNVRAGRVYTNEGKAVADSVIRERSALAETGVISAFVRLGRTVTIKLQSRGVVDGESGEKVLKSAMFDAVRAVTALLGAEPNDASVMETARLAIRRVIAKELGSKP